MTVTGALDASGLWLVSAGGLHQVFTRSSRGLPIAYRWPSVSEVAMRSFDHGRTGERVKIQR